MMNNLLQKFLIFSLLVISLTSCEIIGDIFKAGVWVGVIGVALVVALVLYVLGKMRR